MNQIMSLAYKRKNVAFSMILLQKMKIIQFLQKLVKTLDWRKKTAKKEYLVLVLIREIPKWRK